MNLYLPDITAFRSQGKAAGGRTVCCQGPAIAKLCASGDPWLAIALLAVTGCILTVEGER